MGLFSKSEVIILKESSDAKKYLEQLKELRKGIGDSSKHLSGLDKEINMVKAGIAGEDAIMFELKNSGMDLVVLHDILLVAPSGNTAQIDFYVITPYIVVVIECKNLYGNIKINSKGDFIRTISYGGSPYEEGIYSPITQNERHLQVIKECKLENANILKRAGINSGFEDYHKSLVVLANPKTVVNDKYAKKEVKSTVIRADQLISTLKSMNEEASKHFLKDSMKDMLKFGENMLARNNEERKDYFVKYRKWKAEIDKEDSYDSTTDMNVSSQERMCPRCGKRLILRTASKGEHTGEQFWGCESFPKCRYHEYL